MTWASLIREEKLKKIIEEYSQIVVDERLEKKYEAIYSETPDEYNSFIMDIKEIYSVLLRKDLSFQEFMIIKRLTEKYKLDRKNENSGR